MGRHSPRGSSHAKGASFGGAAASNGAKNRPNGDESLGSEKTVMHGVSQSEKTVMPGHNPPSAAPSSGGTLDSEKTVMAHVGTPAKPASPPSGGGTLDSEKTVMAHVGTPAKPALDKPAAPPSGGGTLDSEKTVMAHVDAKPAAPAKKPAEDFLASESTVMVDPSLMASGTSPGTPSTPTATPTNVDNAATAFFSNNNATPNTNSTPSQHTGGGSGLVAGQLPQEGQRMNQYEIIRLIGEGGMGSVFLARDTKLGRRVAIKFLQSADPELTQRFIIEARATARVEHENIVSIYEVGEWNGSPFMVLQFLQGQGLNKLIPRGKRMPVPRVIELMSPVLRALSYAHGEGIVHRDLKPDNIFVTDAGVTKVLDFGIAKVAHGEDRTTDGEAKNVKAEDLKALAGGDKNMTRHGAIMGTMPYMSPEQWGNGVAIDNTTDIWAAGVIMYIMLTGKHPLDPLEGHELMVTGFLDEPTPSLRDKAPDLPAELAAVIDKCLLKEKAKRWQDALQLLRALEPFQPGRFAAQKTDRIEESPYNGLASFQEEDASRFFGRNRETASMTQRLRERPIMAIVGPSGIGKSSFVRAGVVPALRNSGENWDISVIRPGRTPLMSLANLLTQVAGTSANVAEEVSETQKVADRLREEPGYLGTALRRQARKERKHLLLFIDQFEELYTLVPDQAERLAFTAALAAAADDPASPMRVIISIRSDFIDRATEDPQFMDELSKGLFFLTAPTRDGMRDALVQPAEMAGYKFENDGIVDEMLDHLASTSGALPLLQFTADRLWQERDPSRRMLTEKSYRALGGISGALAAHADRVLEQIPPDQQPLVRALLIRLVTPDRTRAIVPVEDLKETLGKSGADVQGLIDKLVAARLLTIQTGGGGSGSTVEIVHESLIAGWPQLSKWLDEGHEDAAFLEQLRNASRQWHSKGKDSGLLWRGEMVEEAKRFIRRFRGELPDQQAAFLKAVIDQSTRAARVRKTLYIIGAAVLLAMLAAAAVALVVINNSREETRQAAILAQENAVKAQESAEDAAKKQKIAEKALEEAQIAELARDAANEGRTKALEEAVEAKKKAEENLVLSQKSEEKATIAAAEAVKAKAEAEQRAIEATEAQRQAKLSADKLAVELETSNKLRAAAEAARKKAEDRLKGSIATDLK